MIDNTTLSKATKIKIIPTRISKNNVRHYTIIFYNIPFMDKYNIEINKKEIIINNAQSFLYNTQFTFEYHEEPSTTKLITIQFPKED